MAILAILVSAWYNRRTLRQSRILGDASVTVTKQQRADLRYDVLRKELAQWLTMVSEVERVCGELLRRLQQVTSRSETDGSPVLEFVDVGGPSIGALHSIVGQVISEPMTNLTTHGIQLQMLTADFTVLANLHLITQALVGKIQNLQTFAGIVSKNAHLSPEDKAKDSQHIMSVALAIGQDYQFTRQITASRGDLMAYVIRRFNPAAVGALERVQRKYPDVIGNLRPTSVFGPSQPQPQPQRTEPDTEPIATRPAEPEFSEADTEPIA